jgi:hypothetical protein
VLILGYLMVLLHSLFSIFVHQGLSEILVFVGFVNSTFLWGGTDPRPTPNVKDQGHHCVCPLPFEVSGTAGSTRNLRYHQHSSRGHWARKRPLHDKETTLYMKVKSKFKDYLRQLSMKIVHITMKKSYKFYFTISPVW